MREERVQVAFGVEMGDLFPVPDHVPVALGGAGVSPDQAANRVVDEVEAHDQR